MRLTELFETIREANAVNNIMNAPEYTLRIEENHGFKFEGQEFFYFRKELLHAFHDRVDLFNRIMKCDYDLKPVKEYDIVYKNKNEQICITTVKVTIGKWQEGDKNENR